ncbi:MAG: hypothetical protein A2X94_09795 [Bdellovibrionales bacterium GWB1_55_8]|nr:MAG: hypothetical protein A2X94_09795 [Bdellovibrionales bacterium GWB1_55_8]
MKQVRQQIISSVAILSMFTLVACSSSPKTDDELPLDDGAVAADAETDAVPQVEPEALTGLDDAPAESLAAPVQEQAFTGETQDYTVQSGDTLMKIAFETYGDLYRWKDIYELNRERLSSISILPPGMVLKVQKPDGAVVIERNGEKYLIKIGDTLGTISRDVYGNPGRWKEIWQNNRQMIHDPNKIFAGFHLYYVPDAGSREEPQIAPAPLAQPSTETAPEAREPAAAAPDWGSSGDSGFGQ